MTSESRPSPLGATVAPTLTGLSLAAGIAREAVDAVPIVKQVLGAVVKILALAEKIDKDRDALHALADKSSQLAGRVKDVLGNEEPDPKLFPSIERMRVAFEDVAAFMEKHIARNRFHRGLCYAFTVNHHVDRLSRSLENALQEICAVTLLSIKQDAQYDGEFRRIRDCDVDKLELFREEKHEEHNSHLVVRYHSARVDGQLLVVRSCEGTDPQDWHERDTTAKTPYNQIASHDKILKELSTVQRSHPNITRIYGWGKGSTHNRFMVFKSGFRSPDALLNELPDPVTTGIHWALTLLDAVHHLRLMGIFWGPYRPSYVLDDQLQPMIGLKNDLRRMYRPESSPSNLHHHIFHITLPLRSCCQRKYIPVANILAQVVDCSHERLASIVGKSETLLRERYVILKADISNRRIVTNGALENLLLALEEDETIFLLRSQNWIWGNILAAVGNNGIHRIENGLHAVNDTPKFRYTVFAFLRGMFSYKT